MELQMNVLIFVIADTDSIYLDEIDLSRNAWQVMFPHGLDRFLI